MHHQFHGAKSIQLAEYEGVLQVLVMCPRMQAEFYAQRTRLLTFNDNSFEEKKGSISSVCGFILPRASVDYWVCKMLGEKGQMEKRMQGNVFASIKGLMLSYHRMVWVERDLKDHFIPTPLP